jgi:hypothetical protein
MCNGKSLHLFGIDNTLLISTAAGIEETTDDETYKQNAAYDTTCNGAGVALVGGGRRGQ